MKMVMLMTPPMCLVLNSLYDADDNEQKASAASHWREHQPVNVMRVLHSLACRKTFYQDLSKMFLPKAYSVARRKSPMEPLDVSSRQVWGRHLG